MSIFQYEPNTILNEVVLGKPMEPYMYRSSVRGEYEYISKFMNNIVEIIDELEPALNTIDLIIIKQRFESVINQGMRQEWFKYNRVDTNADYYKAFDKALKHVINWGHTTNNEVAHINQATSRFVTWCNNHEQSIQITNFLLKSVLPSLEFNRKIGGRKEIPAYDLDGAAGYVEMFADLRRHAKKVINELKTIAVFVGQDSLKQSQRELDLKKLNEILFNSGVKPWHK